MGFPFGQLQQLLRANICAYFVEMWFVFDISFLFTPAAWPHDFTLGCVRGCSWSLSWACFIGFFWFLLCLPDTRLMTSMFPMYLLGAVVVWMTLIWMMIPSILVQTLVLMMILMETMVIPTLCQQMDTVSKYIFRILPSIHTSSEVPPRSATYARVKPFHASFYSIWTSGQVPSNIHGMNPPTLEEEQWRTWCEVERPLLRTDYSTRFTCKQDNQMFERLKENLFGITWAEWRTKLQQKVRGHRQQRQLDTVVAARVRQI